MNYYCSKCDSKLISKRVTSGNINTQTQTKREVHGNLYVVTSIRCFVCPNGCELKRISVG